MKIFNYEVDFTAKCDTCPEQRLTGIAGFGAGPKGRNVGQVLHFAVKAAYKLKNFIRL